MLLNRTGGGGGRLVPDLMHRKTNRCAACRLAGARCTVSALFSASIGLKLRRDAYHTVGHEKLLCIGNLCRLAAGWIENTQLFPSPASDVTVICLHMDASSLY